MLKTGAALAGTMLLVIAGALLFRQELARQGAVLYLESQGVTVRDLTVSRVSPNGIEARDIVLGDNGEIALERLSAVPRLEGFDVTVTQVRVDGLSLKLNLTGEAPLLGSLQPLADGLLAGNSNAAGRAGDPKEETTTPPAAPSLPKIALEDATVVFETPSGPMTGTLDGGMTPLEDGTLTADATLSLESTLGAFRARLEAKRRPNGATSLIAEINDGHLAWQDLSVGRFQGALSAEINDHEGPQLSANLDLKDLDHRSAGAAPLHLDQGALKLNASSTLVELSVTLQGDGEHLALEGSAGSPADVGDRREVTLSLQGEASSAGGLARLVVLPGPAVEGGSLVLQARGTASLPAAEMPPTSVEAALDLLSRERLQLQGDAILAEVTLADGTQGISAHLPLAAAMEDRRLTLTLTEDAAVRIERPARETLHGIGVPDDLLPLVASGLNLTLAGGAGGGALPFRITASPAWPPETVDMAVTARASSEQGLTLRADAEGTAALDDALAPTRFNGPVELRAEAKSLAIGGREARGVELALPLSADYGAEGLSLKLSEPGSLHIDQFGEAAPLRLDAPLSVSLDTLSLEAPRDAGGYRYRLAGREDGAAFALTAADGPPLEITAGALELGLDGHFDPATGHEATLTARLATLALSAYDFTAEATEIDIGLDRSLRPATSRFVLGAFQVGGNPAVTVPLMMSGRLLRQDGGYDITADLTVKDGPDLAEVTGRYDDDGSARVTLDGRPLSFAPEGLQPGALSPLLADLKEVSGTVEADGERHWPQQASDGGTLRLDSLSFGGPATVDGLDLRLALDSLLPPASPPGQQLTIDSLDVGLPIQNIAIDFALEPKPAFVIADGGFQLGGAHWRIEPATLDPSAERNRAVLATDSLDLATLFSLLGVDGLSGTGTLKGRLPVIFANGDVVIEDSRFDAQRSGVLSIRIDALRSALSGSGEAVDAAVRALEDFRYDNLSITLEKTAENDATVRLSTLGSNPSVMNGQPFQFNINLESNLTSVLNALKQGYSLSDDALKRAWKLRQ